MSKNSHHRVMRDLDDERPILCLDFDGVLHSYQRPWIAADIIPDPPVHGAMDFLFLAMEHFSIAVVSWRSHQDGGIEAMYAWVTKCLERKFGMETAAKVLRNIWFPLNKPPAHITIDDRGYRFTGVFPEPKSLLDMQPWNYAERHPPKA